MACLSSASVTVTADSNPACNLRISAAWNSASDLQPETSGILNEKRTKNFIIKKTPLTTKATSRIDTVLGLAARTSWIETFRQRIMSFGFGSAEPPFPPAVNLGSDFGGIHVRLLYMHRSVLHAPAPAASTSFEFGLISW